jgi:hypothetical protein
MPEYVVKFNFVLINEYKPSTLANKIVNLWAQLGYKHALNVKDQIKEKIN